MQQRRALAPFAYGVDPAVRGFVESDPFQLQMIAVRIPVDAVEDAEGFFGQILGCWNTVKDDGFVSRQAVQKVEYRSVAGIDQKRVVPKGNDVFVGQRLDVREIHHHAIGRVAGTFNDVTR